MAKIVSVEQMVAIETQANKSGLPYNQMMENAGMAVADRILAVWPEDMNMHILILVGTGNNGGDGLVAGNYLAEAGAEVRYYLVKDRPEDDANLARVRDAGALIAVAAHDQGSRALNKLLDSSDLIIDALLGTGFKLPLRGEIQALLKQVKRRLAQSQKRRFVVAIDCPSGLDCDTGEVAPESIPADITITLAAAKYGLLAKPGSDYVGNIFVGKIGLEKIDDGLSDIDQEMMDLELAQAWLPSRPRDAHKGTFGRVLIVAGSINYPGAAVLAAKGAYRCGSGLVTLAVPEPIYTPLVSTLPEATWIILPHTQGAIASAAVDILTDYFSVTGAVLLGPGIGQERQTEKFILKMFKGDGAEKRIGFMDEDQTSVQRHMPPLVLDADALKLLTRMEEWASLIPKESILTPHPGEMSVLTGLSVEKIQDNRLSTAKEWSKKWGHVVVLKGANTVVASPGGRVMVIPIATPALAKAGTGDVLAGVIVGLRGQGMAAYEAAALGAYLHGRAGQLAAEVYQTTTSVMAGDVIDALPEALAELEAGK